MRIQNINFKSSLYNSKTQINQSNRNIQTSFGNANNNLPAFLGTVYVSERLPQSLYIPSTEEKAAARTAAVNELKNVARDLINDYEKHYVFDIKECIKLYNLTNKKEGISDEEYYGIEALQNLQDYDFVKKESSTITIKRKSDNKIYRCHYDENECINYIDVVDKEKVLNEVYLIPKNDPPIVRVAMKNSKGEFADFIDFTFDAEKPKLATYSPLIKDKKDMINSIIYNTGSDTYNISYSIPSYEREDKTLFPCISGNFIISRKQIN